MKKIGKSGRWTASKVESAEDLEGAIAKWKKLLKPTSGDHKTDMELLRIELDKRAKEGK